MHSTGNAQRAASALAALVLAGLPGWTAGCSPAASSPPQCTPGQRICSGPRVMICQLDGFYVVGQVCDSAAACVAGHCSYAGFGDGGATTDGDKDAAQDVALDAAEVGAANADAAGADADAANSVGIDSAGIDSADAADGPDSSDAGDVSDIGETISGGDAADGSDAASLPDASDSVATSDIGDIGASTDQADAADAPELLDASDGGASDAADGAADTDVLGPDPSEPGLLVYQRLGNLAALDDLRRVAWHPSGKFALLLGAKGQVLRYQAGAKAVTALAVVGKEVVDLAADPAGGFFAVLGKDAAGATRLWRGAVAGDGAVVFVADAVLPYGEPVAVAAEPGGLRMVVATRVASPVIAYLTLWQDGQGLGKFKAFNTNGGIVDAMWAGTGLPGLSGSQAIVTSQGLNGAGSNTWVLDSNTVLGNGWLGGFGNGGGAAWRPQGSYGIVTGTSSNVVYVFDGTWTSTYLPGVNNGASPQAVGWKGDGTRALVVGRATGAPLAATVIEHRPGWSQGYSKSDWLNQSIPGFDKAPWAASFNTHLLDVAWRPNTLCDEGLIVGSDTGATGQPNYGLAIRFYDSDDPACAPLP